MKRHVDLFLIGEEGKIHYVLIKELSTFMYNYTPHRGRKHFFRYCLQALSTKEILKCYINDCFKINGKQMIRMPKNGDYVKLKNYERKMKSPFMIFAYFESILVPVF